MAYRLYSWLTACLAPRRRHATLILRFLPSFIAEVDYARGRRA